MRHAYLWFGAFFISAASLWAGLPITTIAGAPGPTTAPVPPTRVTLLPFNAVGQPADNAWISEAIDQDLAHDLSRNRAIQLIRASATQPVVNGLATARDANAQRLISGSYQVVDDQLRINAEVTDVDHAQPVGEAKATGRVRDLFQLEDSLAMQLWHILPQGADQTASDEIQVMPQVTPLQDDQVVQSAPHVYEPSPVYDTTPDNGPDYGYTPYASVYPYSSFGFGYPYGFGVPLFIYGGHGYHGSYHGGGGGFHGHYGGGATHTGTVVHGGSPFVGGGSHFSAGGSHFGGGGHR